MDRLRMMMMMREELGSSSFVDSSRDCYTSGQEENNQELGLMKEVHSADAFI